MSMSVLNKSYQLAGTGENKLKGCKFGFPFCLFCFTVVSERLWKMQNKQTWCPLEDCELFT